MQTFALLILGLLAVLVAPSSCLCLNLTPDEQEYVRKHPSVTLCVDPDWTPFERINQSGEHEGIAADLLALVSQRTGLRFSLVRTPSWDDSLTASQEGRCEVLSFLNSSPKREKWLTFTSPLLKDPNVFITREEHPFIADPEGLSGESIALPRGTFMEEMVRKEMPYLRIILTETENEAVQLVSERKAHMTLRSLIVAAYTIRNEGLFNLKISGQAAGYANQLRMGVIHGEPTLLGILEKGVKSITPQEREQVINRHVSIKAQLGVDYALVLKVAAAFVCVLIVAMVWVIRLRRLNAEIHRLSITDQLTGLYNRTKLQARFPVELERAQRYGRPLSLVLLDIDHFKRVNDEMGHLAGDAILVAIAHIVSKATRTMDVACRWGGEEFLVLCPETGMQQALILAERIRISVEEADFQGGHRQSVSIGVATFVDGDTVETLVKRADDALYQCKHSGRNKTCAM